MLLKKPSFTAIVILALAIGIGANTAIFSVVNAILLRPLPYNHFERISMIWMNNPKLGVAQDWHSYPNYMDYKEQNQVFEDMAAFNDRSFNLTGAGDPVRTVGVWTTASMFSVMGVEPALGPRIHRRRGRARQGSGRGVEQPAVAAKLRRRPRYIGQPISLKALNRNVVGGCPQFCIPGKRTELWIPVALSPQRKAARQSISFKAVGPA